MSKLLFVTILAALFCNFCRALLNVVERGWPNALDFSLDLELNIPPMYCLMNNSSMECFVHYLMNSNCACVCSTTLDNFALDQTSLDKLQSFRLHSTRWPNALDISLNMHVERCIVKSRERLARALVRFFTQICPFLVHIDSNVFSQSTQFLLRNFGLVGSITGERSTTK